MHTRTIIGVSFALGCNVGTPGAWTSGPGSSAGSTSTVSTTTGEPGASTSETSLLSTSSATTGDDPTTGGSTTGTPLPSCPDGSGLVYGSRAFVNPGLELTAALAIDPSGRLSALYASSVCQGATTLQFGGTVFDLDAASSQSLVIAQYDLALGNTMTHMFVDTRNATGEGLTVDVEGNVYVVGSFDESIKIPSVLGEISDADESFTTPNELWSTFVAVFDPAGNRIWSEQLRSQNGIVQLYAVATGTDGFVVAGTYSGVLEPNPGCPYVPHMPSDPGAAPPRGLIVRAYDATFAPRWTRCSTDLLEPSSSNARLMGVAIAPDGGVVASGDWSGKIALADPANTASHVGSHGQFDALVVGWDAAGNHVWHRTCSTETNDQVYDVDVGLDGRVVVGGRVGDKQRCSASQLQPGSTHTRGFAGAFHPTEPPDVWIFDRPLTLEGELEDEIASMFYEVVVEPCGGVVLAGFAHGDAQWQDFPDLGFGDGDPEALKDIIVARLSEDGTPIWSRRFASMLPDVAIAAALDAQGSVYVGGSYEAEISGVGPELWPGKSEGECAAQNAFLLHISP